MPSAERPRVVIRNHVHQMSGTVDRAHRGQISRLAAIALFTSHTCRWKPGVFLLTVILYTCTNCHPLIASSLCRAPICISTVAVSWQRQCSFICSTVLPAILLGWAA